MAKSIVQSFIERIIENRQELSMKDVSDSVNKFLEFNEFNKIQKIESDFDKEMKKLLS